MISYDTNPRLYQWSDEELRAVAKHAGSENLHLAPYNYTGCVVAICDANKKVIDIVKAVEKDSPEHRNLAMLLSKGWKGRGRDHTVPVKLELCTNTVLIFMPVLRRTDLLDYASLNQNSLYEMMSQMIEGVRFMHDHHIAHVDISHENMMQWSVQRTWIGFEITPLRPYFIDFGSSRYLPPGTSPIVEDFGTRGGRYSPPGDRQRVHAFAHDIFCLGTAFDLQFSHAEYFSHFHRPSTLMNFIYTLTAEEPKNRPGIQATQKLWADARRLLLKCASMDPLEASQAESIGWKRLVKKYNIAWQERFKV